MVFPNVLSLTEEYSGQVVLGFPFGEDPAGQIQLGTCTKQSSSLGTRTSIWRFPIAIDYGDEPGAIRYSLCPTLNLLWHLPLAANTINLDRGSGPFP